MIAKAILSFALLGFSLIGCKDHQSGQPTPEALTGTWMHSHEEDTDTYKVYRPADFDFPPSRGRTGFTLQEDGSATYIGIAPADGPAPEPASWSWQDGNTLLIQLQDGEAAPLALEVLSVDEEMLKVKQ